MPFLVTAGPLLEIAGVVGDVQLGDPASFTFTALNVTGGARFTVLSEDFPSEWDFTDNGDDTATLDTAAAETVGEFSITIRCIDAARQPIVRTYRLRVFEISAALLQENGFALLLESGDLLLIE